MNDETISSFVLDIPEEQLLDLRRRLAATRWPSAPPVSDWSQGVPLAPIQALTEYWATQYDWRRCEAQLNGFGQFRTVVDGVGIHFLHIRSPDPNALPLLLTHGWPGSVIEFRKVIGPLSNPVAHGGTSSDAFHLVIPSLPGYGFSDDPQETGWGIGKIANVWARLMQRLGYENYVAQGGDWGAGVTTAMGVARPAGLAAIHVNLPVVLPDGPYENLSPAEAEMLAAVQYYGRWEAGYSTQQMTRPQTVGYGLADSPVGQAAWIFEKFKAWMDCDGDPLNVLTRDELLDNIMLYWLPNKAASSARLYWESFAGGFSATELHIPTGCSIFPKELYRAPRSWAERCIHNLIYWNELDKGGHFAAFEQPGLFVNEIRTCFRQFR